MGAWSAASAPAAAPRAWTRRSARRGSPPGSKRAGSQRRRAACRCACRAVSRTAEVWPMPRSRPRLADSLTLLVALGLVLLAGPLLACGATSAPASGGTSASAPAPAAVARDEGYFAKYGIDAELVPIPGGERIVTALVSGEIPITALASTALLTASLGGADLVFLGSWANQLRYGLYARPEIASVRDLRG